MMHGTTADYLAQVLYAKFGRPWCVSCREKVRVSRKHLSNLLCEQAEHTEHFQWVNDLICKLSLLFSSSVVSDFLLPHGLQFARLLCPWDFPGKNTELRYYFLLQGTFLTQGSNPTLLLAGRFFTIKPPGKPSLSLYKTAIKQWVGSPWWHDGQNPGLSLPWPGFNPWLGTEILQANISETNLSQKKLNICKECLEQKGSRS